MSDQEKAEFLAEFVSKAKLSKVSLDEEDQEWFFTLKHHDIIGDCHGRFFTRDNTHHYYFNFKFDGPRFPNSISWICTDTSTEVGELMKEKLQTYKFAKFSDYVKLPSNYTPSLRLRVKQWFCRFFEVLS